MSSLKVGGPNELFHDRGKEYLERVARESAACRDGICRQIAYKCGNYALAEEVADIAIGRVNEHAMRHGLKDEIVDVKAFCFKAAYNALWDKQHGKLKADKVKTVSWDAEQNAGLQNQIGDSSAKQLQKSLELDQLVKLALRDATDEQRQIFKLLFEDGMSTREIAGSLNIKERAAEYQINKLKAMMRAALGRHLAR